MRNLPTGREIPTASIQPIQNTRYLDAAFVGTSTGSIAAPYSDLTPFLAEIAGSDEAWELWVAPLSGSLIAAIPAISAALVVRGINPLWTFDTTWNIDAQVDGPSFDFYDLDASFFLAGGALEFAFTRCFIGAIVADASSTGVAVFYDCVSRGCITPDFAFRVYGGSMSDSCEWSTGRFYNVSFGDNFNFTPGAGESSFVGCTFGTGGTISNANAPTITMDSYSNARFVASGSTFAGTIVVL